MVSVLIISHGSLARELLTAAQTISGNRGSIKAICLEWDESYEGARRLVGDAIAGLDISGGLLMLTDLYGNTPYNVAASFATGENVEVVSGVNLPMVLRLCCLEDSEVDTAEVARWIQRKGRRSICRSSAESRNDLTPASSALAGDRG